MSLSRFLPPRRSTQAACLLLFLTLFGLVCWPYTARPSRIWSGWLPVEVDAETGSTKVQAEHAPEARIAENMVLFVVDQGADAGSVLGAFRVVRAGDKELELVPVGLPRPEELEKLSTSFGPWSLHEAEPSLPASHYADNLRTKEKLPAELLLALDPLVSLSAAIAARTWVWSLALAAAVLAACLFIPRGFCAYVCPLGTTIDLFDWLVGRRLRSHFTTPAPSTPTPLPQGERGGWRRRRGKLRPRLGRGWWVHLKYYVLLGVLVAAGCGVLISGYVSAIPVITRALAFAITPFQTAAVRGWHQVPPLTASQAASLALFVGILGLGLFAPRFWCRYVCPSGAVFSLGNLFRLSQRKVEATCIDCGKCVKVCPFDAIHPDFTTRTADCTFCQTCGRACPTGAIQYVGRWRRLEAAADAGKAAVGKPAVGRASKPVQTIETSSVQRRTGLEVRPRENEGTGLEGRPTGSDGTTENPDAVEERPLGRRGFLAAGIASGVAAGGAAAWGTRALGARRVTAYVPVRPPGSVPEREFLRMCVRCGECFQACPNSVLQPLGLQQGLDGLWTPQAVADWSGCEPSCNNCGQVCPTGAIRQIPLEEKRVARMGLAVVDEKTCLPYAGLGDCRLCVDECTTAQYNAIEFLQVGTQAGPDGQPIEGTGFLAPVVLAERCVGCGLCQTRCLAINGVQKRLIRQSAIRVEAGQGKEDRLMTGSYLALRREEEARRNAQEKKRLESGVQDGYLPEFLK